MANFEVNLRDGFQEVFDFRRHRMQLRGVHVIEEPDDNSSKTSDYNLRPQSFISWDVKKVYLWETRLKHPEPVVLEQAKFSNQPNFLRAMVLVSKMKVFVAAVRPCQCCSPVALLPILPPAPATAHTCTRRCSHLYLPLHLHISFPHRRWT
jgi:hypothetical protein